MSGLAGMGKEKEYPANGEDEKEPMTNVSFIQFCLELIFSTAITES